MKEVILKIHFERAEDPKDWGTKNEGDNWINYLVIKNKKEEFWFEEGHYVYKLFKVFIIEHPEILKGATIVTLKSQKGEKEFQIKKMITEIARL